MIFLVVILTVISTVSIYALYRSVNRNLEFMELIEETNDQIDEAIVELDYYYKRLDKKAKLDLFSDDPTIRELVEDMKQAKQVISLISKKLSGDKDETENQASRIES